MLRWILVSCWKFCLIGLVTTFFSLQTLQRAHAWLDTTFDAGSTLGAVGDCRLIQRSQRIGTSQYLANVLLDDFGNGAFRLGPNGLNIEITTGSGAANAVTNSVDPITVAELQDKCGLQQVSNFAATFDAMNFAALTTISVKFRAVLPVGKSAVTATGDVTGDGGMYDFVYSYVAANNNSVPVQTATVTPVASNTAPTITSSATSSVEENQTSAIDVQATDDSDSEGAGNGLTFTLTATNGFGTDNGLFDIDANTGVVTFKNAPDFENPNPDNAYDVQVTVTDSGGLAAVQNITVNVTDVDEVVPTVAITTDSGGSFNESAPGTFTATVTFNENVTGFLPGELTATNATVASTFATGSDGDAVYTIVITPAGTGDVALNVAANVAEDSVGNDNTAATQVTVTQNDNVAPTVAITTDSGGSFNQSTPGTFTATVTFSENVTGFLTSEITATNATVAGSFASGSVGDAVYTIVITPAGTGDVALNVAASVAQDGGANDNTAAAQVTVTQNDNVAPTLTTVTVASNNADPTLAVPGDTITLTFTASEALQPPAPTVTIAGLPAMIGGMSPSFAATLVVDAATPVGNVAINISGFQDAAGNPGTAVTATTDGSSVSVGDPGASVEETQMVIAEFMSNRAAHILNNQPSLVDRFTGNSSNGGGDFGLLALNGNRAGMSLAFSTSRSKILAARAKSRLDEAHAKPAPAISPQMMSFAPSNESDAAHQQIAALGHTPTANENGEEAALSTYSDDRTGSWDIWTEIYGSMASSGSSESTLWVGYVGAHIFISPDALVGFMGQVDWADETNSAVNSNADGVGWMVGPYIAGKIPNQNVYYEARASWGRSDNDVSPIGTYTDSFETERWMALAKLEGSYHLGNVTLKPEVRVAYYEETQESYTDSSGIPKLIPEQTISLGEFRFGPNFTWDHILDDGTLFQPSVGITGVFNFGIQNNAASQGFALGDEELRARFAAGFSATNPMGMIFTASGFYDGIGIDDYYSYGGSVKLTVPVN